MPPGLYDSSLEEISNHLGWNPQRQQLVQGLTRYLQLWDRSGFISDAYIDGSFVTSKDEPQDVDIILVATSVALNSREFERLVSTYSLDRTQTKQTFGCEGFAVAQGANLNGWLAFFGHDRAGNERGLLRIRFPL